MEWCPPHTHTLWAEPLTSLQSMQYSHRCAQRPISQSILDSDSHHNHHIGKPSFFDMLRVRFLLGLQILTRMLLSQIALPNQDPEVTNIAPHPP